VSDELLEALKERLGREYQRVERLAEGGASYVFLAVTRELQQRRVIKVLKLQLAKVEVSLPDGTVVTRDFGELFRSEITRILTLSHRNIIRLYDAGSVQVSGVQRPYYIMEYLEGSSNLVEYLRKQGADLSERILVETLMGAVEGLAECHRKGIFHGDVKPGNILVSNDGEVRITDFGFSKSAADLDKESADRYSLWIGDKRFMADEVLALMTTQRSRLLGVGSDERVCAVAVPRDQLRERGRLYDLCSLGKTIQFLWDTLECDQRRLAHEPFLKLCIKRLENAPRFTELRYDSARAFLADLQKLAPGYSPESIVHELNLSFPDTIRIPVHDRVPLTARLEKLVNLPIVQRLRGVRQLGLTHLVYPGAVHTRFEHSLGVLEKTAQYVRALWGDVHNQFFAQCANEKDLGAVLVAALLHDIGHYPLAHAFEEVEPKTGSVYKHSQIAVDWLRGVVPYIWSDDDQASFERFLGDDWGLSTDDVVAVLTGAPPTANLHPELLPCLRSIISGPLDADKLDYLIRDSTHCGNPYGARLDLEKFLQSVVAPGEYNPVGIREKGLPAVESAFLARYHMFVTVYWHHTIRAAERMVSEAVRLLRGRAGEDFADRFRAFALGQDDESMIWGLYRWLTRVVRERRPAEDLLRPLFAAGGGREQIYRRVLTISSVLMPGRAEDLVVHEAITEMFDSYMRGNVYSWKYGYFEGLLREELIRLAGGGLPSHAVLLDVPDPRVEEPTSFQVYDEQRNATPIGECSTLYREFLKDWRRHARKVRIFAAPAVAERLRSRFREVWELTNRLAQEVHNMTSLGKDRNETASLALAPWGRLNDPGRTSPPE